MKGRSIYKLSSIFLVLAYVLSACSGAASPAGGLPGGGKPESKEIAFTGTVESVSADSITVNGQTVAIDATTMLDSNIKVGDFVKVEAQVTETGAVIALKVEASSDDDISNDNDANSNDDGANTNDNTNTVDDNSNTDDDNANANSNDDDSSGAEQEVFGVVDAITAESVTVGGVTYSFASFTEFKDVISVGDQVKLHVIVNADGTFTVREIEKFDDSATGDDNSNDDNGNDDDSNSNDDDDDDDNANDNDDDSDDDNGNDSGSNNNDDDDDDNGNSNGD
ncbi:MAG: hypothetical protein HXY35_14240 [Chloroflexi bacterium]|nr:hypothetical protein [Chloroflexota bacterium]